MARSRAPRIPGIIIKAIALLLVFSVNGILIWRMCSSQDPASMRILTVNAATHKAYTEKGEALCLCYQEQASITRTERNYGYFSITQCVFIPEAEQVQIVLRYNNSTLTHLKEDYGLPEIPDRSLDLFDVTLLRTTDPDPQNPEDNYNADALIKTRFFPTVEDTKSDTSALYNYRRYVFDGVSVEDLTLGVFVDIYYVGDVRYEERAYGTLCLYDHEMEWQPYTLTKEDLRALAEYPHP